MRCTRALENRAYAAGRRAVAGVDEVGRGALFGPVVAAAVVLDPAHSIRGLNDSKLLSAEQREYLDGEIRSYALAFSIRAVDAGRIDAINIYQASRVAMEEAVSTLSTPPDHLLVDAMPLCLPTSQETLIHGDARSASIAAASIVAKVFRDALLRQWDVIFPPFRLGSNKGYSTPDHLSALQHYGPTPLHRRSFSPITEMVILERRWEAVSDTLPLPFGMEPGT